MLRKSLNCLLCSKWYDAGAVALATSPMVREDRLVMENWQTIIMAFVISLSCNRSISFRWMEMGSDMHNWTEFEHRWESLLYFRAYFRIFTEIKQGFFKGMGHGWKSSHHLLTLVLFQTCMSILLATLKETDNLPLPDFSVCELNWISAWFVDIFQTSFFTLLTDSFKRLNSK